MRLKIISAAVAAAITTWAPATSARETVALPSIIGVGSTEAQARGIDTTGSGLLTINPNININTQNDVGGAITSGGIDAASILFTGSSTITGFTGTSLIRFADITAGANATTTNFNGNVFTKQFNVSGTGTVNFNGSLNPGVTAANTIFAGDGFINIGANQLFVSAITTLTANTGTLTLNGGSSVNGAIGGASGLKQINVVGGNASVIGAVQAQQFNLGINTLNINGALTTNAAGTISTTLASDAVFGRIVLTGNSAINAGGVTVVPTVTGALTNNTTYRIVSAPSGTNNAVVSVVNNNPRYTFAGLPTTLGNVDIQLTGIVPLATLVTAPGALAVAPILDINAPVGTELRALQDAVAVLPDKVSINNALLQLSTPGNTNLAAPWIAGQATRMFEDHLMARLDEVQAKCCTTDCDPNKPRTEQKAQECEGNQQHANWWGKAIGGIGNQDGRNNMSGYETEAVGIMMGYDIPLGNYSRAGLGGGYINNNIYDNDSPAKTRVDSYQVTGYFEYAPQPWFVQAALTAGVDKYDSSRYVSVPGFNRKVNSDFSGQQYTAQVAIGKHFYVNHTTITPLASLKASHISVDSYKERVVGDLNLRVEDQDYDFVQSSLGVKMERVIQTSTGAISPEVHAKWMHDFNSTTMHQDAMFAGGPSIRTEGIKHDRDLYNVGAGFTMLYCNCEANAWSVKGLYDYKWNDSDYSAHQVSLIANLKF